MSLVTPAREDLTNAPPNSAAELDRLIATLEARIAGTPKTVADIAKDGGVRLPGETAALRFLAFVARNSSAEPLGRALAEYLHPSQIYPLIDGTFVASLDPTQRQIVGMLQASEEPVTDEEVLRARTHEVVNEARIEQNLPALPRRRDLTDVEIKALVERVNAEDAAAAAAGSNPPAPDMAVSRETKPAPKTSPPSYRPRGGQPVDIRRIICGQLVRLIRRRGLYPLPDNKQSRRWLQALLDLGLAADRALSMAPWIGTDLAEMLDATMVGRASLSQHTLGRLFAVTYKERCDYKIYHVECIDREPWEVQEAQAERRREKDRTRKAHDREQKAHKERARAVIAIQPRSNAKPIDDFAVGHRQIYAWLDGKGWQTISDMAIAFRSDSCVSRDPTGRRLKHTAIIRKIHRWTNDLVEGGRVGEDYVPFKRGKKKRQVRRFDQAE
jgi:hypothetical protein